MKGKLIWLALLAGVLVYLARTNPDSGAYTDWASKQIVQRSEIHTALAETEKAEPDSLLGELASLGKKLTEKYVQPQVGLAIKEYTKQSDYIFFSTYTTTMKLGSTTYEYVTLGAADRFWLVKAPE